MKLKGNFYLNTSIQLGVKFKGDRFKKTTFSDESLRLFLYIT